MLSLIILLSVCQLCEGRYALPKLDDTQWKTHNVNVKTILDPIHYDLSSNIISPSAAACKFSDSLSNYFSEEGDFSSEGGSGRGGRGGGRQCDVDISDGALQLARAEKKRLKKLVVGKRVSPRSLGSSFTRP